MAFGIAILLFLVALLFIGLALRLLASESEKGWGKKFLLVFLVLFSVQALLFLLKLILDWQLAQHLRLILAFFIPLTCYLGLALSALHNRPNAVFYLSHLWVTLAYLLPQFSNYFSYDYLVVSVQLVYSMLLFRLAFISNLGRRVILKAVTFTFAILFLVIALFDLMIAYYVRSGGRLEQAEPLFLALLIIYSAALIMVTLVLSRPKLLAELVNNLQEKAYEKLDRIAPVQIPNDFSIEQIKQDLIENKSFLEEGFDLNFLASQLQLAPRELSRLINLEAGKGFSAFINDLKVAHAAHLLLANDGNYRQVTQVMYDSGFQTKSSFYREFKSRTGMSPTEYRKKKPE